jgi:hypothetical protein
MFCAQEVMCMGPSSLSLSSTFAKYVSVCFSLLPHIVVLLVKLEKSIAFLPKVQLKTVQIFGFLLKRSTKQYQYSI